MMPLRDSTLALFFGLFSLISFQEHCVQCLKVDLGNIKDTSSSLTDTSGLNAPLPA